MSKYQVMPPLSEQDFQELKSSIAKYGVQVAIEYDEDGNVLDGHHRLQACEELGIKNIPKLVKAGMDEQQKLDYALMVNTARRQLSREQKQELIRQQLRRTPDKSDRQIAGLVGTSNSTVSEARKNMICSGQLCESHTSIGTDGKSYPRKPVTIYNPNENTVSATKELFENAAPELVNAVAEGKVPIMQAHSVMSSATPDEQKEALNRLEAGKTKFLMEGVHQLAAEHAFDSTPEEREEIEEEIKKADAEIDRKHNIIRSIDKAIMEMASLQTDQLPEQVRLYMDCDPNFDLSITLMDINMAKSNLTILEQEFSRSKKLRVVK